MFLLNFQIQCFACFFAIVLCNEKHVLTYVSFILIGSIKNVNITK